MDKIVVEETLTEEDVSLLLECISDVLFVSDLGKHSDYVKTYTDSLSHISTKLLSYNENKEFFGNWGFYENTTVFLKEDLDLMSHILKIILDIHNAEDLSTYVGGEKSTLEKLIKILEG